MYSAIIRLYKHLNLENRAIKNKIPDASTKYLNTHIKLLFSRFGVFYFKQKLNVKYNLNEIKLTDSVQKKTKVIKNKVQGKRQLPERTFLNGILSRATYKLYRIEYNKKTYIFHDLKFLYNAKFP